MTNLVRIDDKFVAVQNKCSEIQHSTVMHCATRGRILRVIFYFHVYFCEKQHPKFYCELRYSSNPRKINLKELGVEIQTVLFSANNKN